MIDSDTLEIKIIDYAFDYKTENDAENLWFIAPEVLSGEEPSSRSDMWSIGMIAYWLLTGTSPYDNENKEKLKESILKDNIVFKTHDRRSISEDVINFIRNLWVRDPKKRFSVKQALNHKWLFMNTIDFDFGMAQSLGSNCSNLSDSIIWDFSSSSLL